MDGPAPSDLDAEHRTGEPTPPGHARWPRISDYWPDTPQATEPEATAPPAEVPAAGWTATGGTTPDDFPAGPTAPDDFTAGGTTAGGTAAGGTATGAPMPSAAPMPGGADMSGGPGMPNAAAGDEITADIGLEDGTYSLNSGAAGYAYQGAAPADPQVRNSWLDEAYPVSPAVPSGAEPGPSDGRPTYDSGVEEPPPTRLISPPPPPRRPGLRLAVALVCAAVFLGISVFVLARMVSGNRTEEVAEPAPQGGGVAVGEPSPPVSIAPAPTPSAASPSAASPSAAGPAFAAGTFVLADDVTEFNLTLGRPAGGAIKVSTPAGSALVPRTAVAGSTVTLDVRSTGKSGSGRLDVLLDERIAWTIRMSGGVRTGSFVLTGGTVRGVELTGGADTLDLALPRLSGALPIRMSGGVHTWRIRTERREPVQVQVRRGAGEVTLYGDRDQGVNRGSRLTAGGGRGLQIEAVAGMGSLTVSAG